MNIRRFLRHDAWLPCRLSVGMWSTGLSHGGPCKAARMSRFFFFLKIGSRYAGTIGNAGVDNGGFFG